MESIVENQQLAETKDKKYFYHNIKFFILFTLPVAYMAIIGAVIVHEIIGHGMITHFLGGEFVGFGILIDGMGWVAIEAGTMLPLKQVIVLSAGAFFTNLFSILFFVLSIKMKKYYLLSLTFLFFAFSFLMDGIPYFFWDAIYQGGIGDISQILVQYPNEGLRIIIILFTGVVGIVGIFLFNYLFMKQINLWLGSKGKPTCKERIVSASVVFIIQTLAWMSFDWYQLIPVPGTGVLPVMVPILITLLILIFLVLFRKPEGMQELVRKPIRWKAPIFISWILCITLIAVIIIWLQYGVAL
ncbi:MAG: hypothetical protein ACYDEX_01225 [Mobilitalea sp.]